MCVCVYGGGGVHVRVLVHILVRVGVRIGVCVLVHVCVCVCINRWNTETSEVIKLGGTNCSQKTNRKYFRNRCSGTPHSSGLS